MPTTPGNCANHHPGNDPGNGPGNHADLARQQTTPTRTNAAAGKGNQTKGRGQKCSRPLNTNRATRKVKNSRQQRTPSYRKRKGYTQALVTLTDSATGKRRDYWLGEYNTPESLERYHQLIAAWEAASRRLPELSLSSDSPRNGPTLTEIIALYWRWARDYYSPQHAASIKLALRLLREHYGTTPAVAFGPNRLRALRECMIQGDPRSRPPRRPWTRPYINSQVIRIRHMFRWAVAHEYLPVSAFERLRTLEPLRRGRSNAVEPVPVKPVPDDMIDAIQPYVSPQVWALIQLQRYTGARGGELLPMRAIDIDMSGDIWQYHPQKHKTEYRGIERTIYLGPRAQQVIKPFLTGRSLDAYLFPPTEAEAHRRALQHAQRATPLSCGNRPGTNQKAHPRKQAGTHYTANSYRRAITYACDQAFPPPPHLRPRPAQPNANPPQPHETQAAFQARLTPKEKAELKDWHKLHRWHPHQLRHAAATNIRRQFGLEAAQIILGHASAEITDAVYAERDMTRAIEIMREAG